MVARNLMVALVSVALLSGCAVTDQKMSNIQLGTDKMASEIGEQADLLIEPVDAVGVRETQNLRDRKVSVCRFVFPEMLVAEELFPGRVMWFGWLVNPQGREFLVQLILEPDNNRFGQLMGIAMIDGTEQEIAGGKMIGFSTRIKKIYSLKHTEDEYVVESRDKLLSCSETRRRLVERYGVDVDQLPRADEFLNELNAWNRVDSKKGWILTPLTNDQFDYVSRINPSYSHSQKWVASTHGSISIDPYGTMINLFFEQIYAAGVKSEGWDFDSVANNQIAGQRIAFILKRKQAVVDGLNRQLKSSGGHTP